MAAIDSWRFWVDDNGRVRTFMVAALSEARAREIVRRALPQAKVFSYRADMASSAQARLAADQMLPL